MEFLSKNAIIAIMGENNDEGSKNFGIGFHLNLADNIHTLQELLAEISEVFEMVPEWRQVEAEEHKERIEDLVAKLIETDGPDEDS